MPYLTSDGWSKSRLIVESVAAGIKDYYQRIQKEIHSRQHSMTISLHRALLSSLTLSSESQMLLIAITALLCFCVTAKATHLFNCFSLNCKVVSGRLLKEAFKQLAV